MFGIKTPSGDYMLAMLLQFFNESHWINKQAIDSCSVLDVVMREPKLRSKFVTVGCFARCRDTRDEE